MKKWTPFFYLFFLIPFLGCEALEELLEEEFEETITFDGVLNVIEKSSVASIDDSVEVATQVGFYDIDSDPDIAQYIEDGTAEITKIKINEIRYTYNDFEGNEEAMVTKAAFLFVAPNLFTMSTSLENGIAIADADERNLLFTHTDNFSELEEQLLDGSLYSLGVQYGAEISKNPVDFMVGITVVVTVTFKADIDNL